MWAQALPAFNLGSVVRRWARTLAVPPSVFKLINYNCVSMSVQEGFAETLLVKFCHIRILLCWFWQSSEVKHLSPWVSISSLEKNSIISCFTIFHINSLNFTFLPYSSIKLHSLNWSIIMSSVYPLVHLLPALASGKFSSSSTILWTLLVLELAMDTCHCLGIWLQNVVGYGQKENWI